MINLFEENNPYLMHYNDNNLLGINVYENTKILDFFDMVSYICYTDFYTNRQEDLENKEKLTIEVPVNNIELFNNIKLEIEKLLTYMTNGEKWTIKFVKQNRKKVLCRKQLALKEESYNSIALLSGGLDSMAGASREKENRTLFVTFSSNYIEANNAQKIYSELIKNSINKNIVIDKIGIEDEVHYTERTRSLIFVASCLIYADYYNIEKIKIYENGIMSLNPKFNFSRRVTKTTNQKTLCSINKILASLNINIKVDNPFKYKTKKEVIDIIPQEYYNMLKDGTRTCSKNSGIVHFRNKSKGNFHCGICIACALRQIGMIDRKEKDSQYLLPVEKYSFKEILKYECKISKNHNEKNDFEAAIYKFNEKRSLVEYYKSYYYSINDGSIFNYLDMKQEYYEDENYIAEITNMLNRFASELEKYFKIMGVEYERI